MKTKTRKEHQSFFTSSYVLRPQVLCLRFTLYVLVFMFYVFSFVNEPITYHEHPVAQESQISTSAGPVRILSACSPGVLQSLTLEEGIGRFARYRSIISGIDTLATVAALPDANVTIALSPAGQIIGYIECSY